MKQNTTKEFSKTRIALIHVLLDIQGWAHTYSDGRGHYPPVRNLIATVSFSLQRKLERPMQKGLDEDQLCELDNLIYRWS
jgi:hypothetical protein